MTDKAVYAIIENCKNLKYFPFDDFPPNLSKESIGKLMLQTEGVVYSDSESEDDIP